ncbi:MAG: hypothetical protein KatS3mg024_1469 [Armatimonadota bacterium]|nr:MAG: hypothetical protein KatS3mg024_1469 [Armatimonadota bacterium]
MVSLVKLTRNLIGGVAGAIAGWLIVEPWPWLTTDPAPGQPSPTSLAALAVLGMIVGGAMGAGLGAAEGVNSGSQRQLARSLAIGLLVGVAGGLVGIYLGQMIYAALAPSPGGVGGLLDFVSQMVARTLGWALWGVLIGAAQGIATGSARRIALGALGGVAGGAAGGFVFELLAQTTGGLMTGEALRLLGFVSIGAGIGLLSSLAQEMFKQAWVRVLVGRGEGREFQIAKPETFVGRDELADIPLFGDPQIAKRHLIIRQVNGRYEAVAAQPGLAFSVNGQMVSSAPLKDGDIIGVGSRQLEFHERVTRTAAGAAMGYPPSPWSGQATQVSTPPPVETPPGVCAFCGQTKDAYGGCACTVGAPSPVQTADYVPGQATGATTQVMGAGAVWTLQVISGPQAGRSLTLSEGHTVTAGRSPDADLSLEGDTFASRRHAVFSVQGGQPVVEDAGSTNGTLVNGVRVTRHTLTSGDTVSIGQTQIRVV